MPDSTVLGTLIPSPSATIARRRVGAIDGVVVTVKGAMGPGDATALRHCLDREMDGVRLPAQASRHDPEHVRGSDESPDTHVVPSVVVVDVGEVTACDAAVLEVLVVARERARSSNVGLHILDRGQRTMHQLLHHAGLA